MKLNFPGGKQLIDTPGPAVGHEVKADNSREGFVDNGLLAWPERLATARKYWPEGRASDFEQLDRRGRHWVDRATGTTYRRDGGCGALLGPTLESVDTWFVDEAGEIVLLIRADRPEGSTVVHGEFFGGEVVNGRIVKGSR